VDDAGPPEDNWEYATAPPPPAAATPTTAPTTIPAIAAVPTVAATICTVLVSEPKNGGGSIHTDVALQVPLRQLGIVQLVAIILLQGIGAVKHCPKPGSQLALRHPPAG